LPEGTEENHVKLHTVYRWEKLLKIRDLKNQSDRIIKLMWISEKQTVVMGGGWNWLRIKSNGGFWY
jgi:hypothetical protein